ncbi:phosphopantetheine-binding protein [Kitasatospora sp. NBC_00315]|uniref:phosphopantetheine-binding protein n=1 Tax=Kitasatospora sp. NBC_00315 TaxID=2975963 RepID=UPI0032564043
MSAALGRDEVVAILAGFGDRTPEEVPEGIDSMELAWLVHQIERRCDRRLDDDTLARMTTVSDVVEVLAGFGEPHPGRA